MRLWFKFVLCASQFPIKTQRECADHDEPIRPMVKNRREIEANFGVRRRRNASRQHDYHHDSVGNRCQKQHHHSDKHTFDINHFSRPIRCQFSLSCARTSESNFYHTIRGEYETLRPRATIWHCGRLDASTKLRPIKVHWPRTARNEHPATIRDECAGCPNSPYLRNTSALASSNTGMV